ncbi:hypothetical protein AC579_224 [Pseudocercospora musae]|uniref:Uncharacterized protein n=1 Tax=Pseudocercospora musae TaxID=113226 RepID=A0A139I9K0_9PEZI|nr:hypothetical protein AC579_224 [Pseudocercospora musae]
MSTSPSMSCPSGGTFYACLDDGKFVGCCASDPCGNTGCLAGNLYAASFEASQYGQYPDQECDAGQFWTCRDAAPPFWGCCMSNPCNSGCPIGDLAGAYLSNNPSDAAPFEALNGTAVVSAASASSSMTSSSAVTDSGASMSMTATGISATASSTASTSPVASSQRSSLAGAIAGGVVGGLAVLAALIFGLAWLRRRRRRSSGPTSIPVHRATEVQQPHESGEETIKQEPTSYFQPSSPFSAQPPYSPAPPSYVTNERDRQRPVSELPGSSAGYEMESGQRYHAYRVPSQQQ